MEEIREKLSNVREVKETQGRVVWESDDFQPDILHSCERIFKNCFWATHSIADLEAATAFMVEKARMINWKEKLSMDRSPILFRVQSRIRGKLKRKLHFQAVKKLFAEAISATEGLECIYEEDREKAEVEIFVHWNDERLSIGIPLANSKRPYLPNPGIRCTLAWAMSHMAKVKPGQTIIDPCVGKGTTIFECIMSFVNVSVFGVDSNEETLQDCIANKNALPEAERDRVSLFLGDGRNLPLKPGSLDVAICDPPFGILHKVPDQESNKESLSMFYTDLLTELHRILSDEGVCVFLISNVSFLEHASWDIYKVHPVRHGRLNASLVLLKKVLHVRKKRKLETA